MDQKCIKLHDQTYPNERVIAFCTNLQCKHRLACGLCYHDYHSDHIAQLIKITDFYTFAQKQMELQNNRPQAQQIEQLKILRSEIFSLIDERCNIFLNDNIAKQPILDDANMQQGITEELVEQLLQPNILNQGNLKSILNLTFSLQQIQLALKTEFKITRFFYEVQDRVYNNCTYSGEMLNNKRHGKGIAKFNNGDTYEGKWKQDKREGEGVYQWGPGNFEGEVYTGTWKDNKKNGFGRNFYKSGNMQEHPKIRYEGYWVDSEKSGQGKMIFAVGEMYEGEWKQNRRNGFGVNRWPNGNQYAGEWKDDKKHGKGSLKIHTGENYNDLKIPKSYATAALSRQYVNGQVEKCNKNSRHSNSRFESTSMNGCASFIGGEVYLNQSRVSDLYSKSLILVNSLAYRLSISTQLVKLILQSLLQETSKELTLPTVIFDNRLFFSDNLSRLSTGHDFMKLLSRINTLTLIGMSGIHFNLQSFNSRISK